MQKFQKQSCRRCGESLLAANRAKPAGSQVWTCDACGDRNYIPGGADCDCPEPGFGRGCSCRVARSPQMKFTSDDWCNCSCHR